jgi:hypothetical protein
MMITWGLGSNLILIAIICLVLAAAGLDLGRVAPTPLGLAFGFGGLLAGNRGVRA